MSPHNNKHKIFIRGTVISVPIAVSGSQLPSSDQDSPPYVIKLVDGSVHKVSPDFLESIVQTPVSDSTQSAFPSWLGQLQKVIYLHEGQYLKGLMK